MSSHAQWLLQCRLSSHSVTFFHSLSGLCFYNHESIKRSTIPCPRFTAFCHYAAQAKKRVVVQEAEQNDVHEFPPQTDVIFRRPNTFSKYFSAPFSRSASPVASATNLSNDIEDERRALSQPIATASTNPSPTELAQSTDNVRSEDSSYIRYVHVALQHQAGSRPSEKKETGELGQNRASWVISSPFRSPAKCQVETVAHAMSEGKPLGRPGESLAGTINEYREGLQTQAYRTIGVGSRAGLMSRPPTSRYARLSRHLATRFSIRRQVLPTPSEILLAALPPKVRKALAPPDTRKMDLSYVAARRWENVSRRSNIGKRPRSRKTLYIGRQVLSSHKQIAPLSLAVILSKYFFERSTSEERALSQLHETETLMYLRTKGYSPDDVLSWSRILSSSNTRQAVLRFVAGAGPNLSPRRPSLPTFLLMFILRARSLKGISLRILLDYIWKHYVGPPSGFGSQSSIRRLQPSAAMIMIVRLIRHARVVLPNSLEEIANLATKMIGQESEGIVDLNRQRLQEISHLYNRLLTLFAMPTSLRPIMSTAIQQKCQFAIIRKMVTFKPHLPVSREGFRALTRIQLAHKKTEEERKWAKSKALSWPPWKEELLGIEADSEDPGKHSRAIHVLTRLIEAGYSHLNWEQTARILAGWDTDGSPTIQTRSLFQQDPILRNEDVKASSEQSSFELNRLWTARITATRTVREAWACFTSYEKSCKHHSFKPYSAMFAKLLYAGKWDVEQADETTSVVPGDGKETWPESTSPHDFLYVPSEPPSIDEFFDMMTKRGIRPGKYLLAELLDKAEDLEEGFKYINAGRLRQEEKDILLGSTGRSAKDIQSACENVAPRVVAAFVRLLCRVRGTYDTTFALPGFSHSHEEMSKQIRTKDPFFYVRNFTSALQSPYSPIWYALFHGLNRRIMTGHPSALHRWWGPLLNTLREVDELGIGLDFGGFTDIAEILEQALLTNRLVLPQQEQGWIKEADPKLQSVLLCKSIFNTMAYGDSVQSNLNIARTTSWLPLHHSSESSSSSSSSPPQRTDLIDIPLPTTLHRTVRILGAAEDAPSILTLLHWMVLYTPQLTSLAAERANSKRQTRYALTAIRYFLEKSWRDDDFSQRAAVYEEWEPGQRDLVMQAKGIVEEMGEEWGGWPSDMELGRYHAVNRRKAGMLRVVRASV